MYLDDTMRKSIIKQRFAEFNGWAVYQYGICGTLILNLVLLQIFNIRKKKGVNLLAIDKYVMMDIILALCSSCLFFLINQIDYNVMLDKSQKDIIDYMVATVFVIILVRPFLLFLVVPSVSKMLLTLVAMLYAVRGFGLLQICYLGMSTQIFSTLF